MPRLPRIYIANCLYYIATYGNRGENIFTDKKDYAAYLELLKKYKEQYKFKLFSFALMPESISLLMELKQGETISMVMHDLNSNYTKYFNNRYSRKGHLFRERFQSLVVEKESYLLNIVRYIHLVPVKSKLAGEPSEYVFSSHLAYLYYSDPLIRGRIKEASYAFADDMAAEVQEAMDLMKKFFPDKKNYADFMAGVTDEEFKRLEEELSRSGLLGSKGFVDSVREEIEKRQQRVDKDRDLMKTVVPSFIIVLSAAAAIGMIYQRYLRRDIPASIPAAVDTYHAPAQPATVEIIKERLIKVSLEELDGTEWIIELMPEGAAEGLYPGYDRIVFKQGTVSAKYFLSKGFGVSNYNLVRQEDETLVWETMQRDTGGEIIYWHGEEKDGSMRGVFERKFPDGRSERVAFKSPGYYKIRE